MTTPISSADIQQPVQPIASVPPQPVQPIPPIQQSQPQAQPMPPQGAAPVEFAPSYNAVQLNLKSPTLNAPPAMPPLPPTATKQWVA